MNETLVRIRDAVDFDTEGGRNLDLARQLADQFVAENPNLFIDMENRTLPELAKAVDVFRDAGMDEQRWQVEAFLLHRYEPQDIGGAATARVRIVKNG